MKSKSRTKGDAGETIAAEWLVKNKNFKILNRNYSTRYGEIDIIAQDETFYVFVEVKYRQSKAYGYPCEAVTQTKQGKIAKSALYYISDNSISTDSPIRFDVIEIIEDKTEKTNYIRHIENAFEWGSY